MKRTTKKLAGRSLDIFLRRFFRSQPRIDRVTAEALTRASQETFANVRVRAPALARVRQPGRVITSQPAPAPRAAPPETNVVIREPVPAAPLSEPPAAETPPDTAPFDPYAIGLVPIFQREGADGLLRKLAPVVSADDLRKMARAQQIALPADLRHPEAEPDAIRQAIVAAVEKRIANRRAAAG